MHELCLILLLYNRDRVKRNVNEMLSLVLLYALPLGSVPLVAVPIGMVPFGLLLLVVEPSG